MHPRKSTQWRGFSNTRARYTRIGNAWVRDRFSGRLKRNKKAEKCSQSFIWANIPGRRTPMSPLRQRSLERVFENWAWRQRTRYFFDDTIPASPSINPFIFGIGGSICKHTSWVDDFCNWCFQTQLGHCDNLHKSGGGRCSAWHHSGFFPSTTFLVILLASSGALYICQHCSMNDLILCYLYCSQTEASTVIVEEELLPRLLAVLPKAPSVRNVVVIPRL